MCSPQVCPPLTAHLHGQEHVQAIQSFFSYEMPLLVSNFFTSLLLMLIFVFFKVTFTIRILVYGAFEPFLRAVLHSSSSSSLQYRGEGPAEAAVLHTLHQRALH